MSKLHKQRQILKNPIRALLIRVAQMGRKLRDMGRNPAHAARMLKEGASRSNRARWRRYWRANQKHQRRFAAMRRNGASVSNIPHSLSLWMVP